MNFEGTSGIFFLFIHEDFFDEGLPSCYRSFPQNMVIINLIFRPTVNLVQKKKTELARHF